MINLDIKDGFEIYKEIADAKEKDNLNLQELSILGSEILDRWVSVKSIEERINQIFDKSIDCCGHINVFTELNKIKDELQNTNMSQEKQE